MKIAILTTTFPKNKNDKVPKFIETQVINLKKKCFKLFFNSIFICFSNGFIV